MNRKIRLFLFSLSFAFVVFPGCTRLQQNKQSGLGTPQQAPACIKQQLAKTSRSWDDSLLPAYPSGQPEVTILRLTIPPGTKLEKHFHPVINAGVVISGELTVIAEDGKVLYLKPGDPIVELVKTCHYGINQGTEPVDLIVFYAGVERHPITVLQGPQK
ncbi:MAG: cupin domain-containing protein [Lentisphaeria bacterium]